MKIIILGAGQVGVTLAENLVNEANDITIVDTHYSRLEDIKKRLDLKTVQGMASFPQVLKQAGIDDADMLIAVTSSDEINMLACQIAHSLFHTPTKIARVRESAYTTRKSLFNHDAIPVDVLISPEQVVTNYLRRLIEHPGTLQVLDFSNGLVQLVAVKAYYDGPLVGKELRYLREHMPKVDARVAAIFRQNHAIKPEGNTIIEADDEVFFITAQENIRAMMSELRRLDQEYKRIMIAGGGRIGERLAETLETRYQIKIIEKSYERCASLTESLSRSLVLHGSASDQELLVEENIEDCDLFVAVTNDDEANIMSSMLAKRLGARKVMALINNPAYLDLMVQEGNIDIAISPQQATISSMLAHVRRGDIVNVHSLRRGAAEAIEIVARGDKKTSKVVGKTLEEIALPKGTTIGAIVRNQKVLIAHDNIVVETNDHLIIFLADKKQVRDVERLFQVSLAFF